MDESKTLSATTQATTQLYLHDRCDACGFQARVIAQTSFGEFWFCAADWRTYRELLRENLLGFVEHSYEDSSRPRPSIAA